MRQKEDPVFAELLGRLRIGQTTNDDIELIRKQVITYDPNFTKLENAVNVYLEKIATHKGILAILPTNDAVNEFNNCIMSKLKIETINVPAIDSHQSSKTFQKGRNLKQKPTLKAKPIHKKINQTAGLETILQVGINSRVMLRRNLDLNRGLVNGAIGTIQEMFLNPVNKQNVLKIRVKFDNINELVDIERIVADYEFKRNVYVSRSQFPLTLAWAITVHKAQGLSLNGVVLDLGDTIFEPGMAYVALSRARKLENVFILDFVPNSLCCANLAIVEYNRLARTANKDAPQIPVSSHAKLNVRNLPQKQKCINHMQIPNKFSKSNKDKRNLTEENDVPEPTSDEFEIPDLNNMPGYPLKLLNSNKQFLSCYANVILQVLIHFGNSFYQAVQTMDNSLPFKRVFFTYLRFLSRNTTPVSAMSLRTVVGEEFTGVAQQDAFNFFCALYDTWPVNIRQIFCLEHKVKRICVCGHTTYPVVHNTNHITVSPDYTKSTIEFKDLFRQIERNQFHCTNCRKHTKHSDYNSFNSNVMNNENKFFYLYINLFRWDNNLKKNIKIKTKITNFNQNEILIPSHDDGINLKFKVSSACVRIGETIESGHYIIWANSLDSNGFIRIEDELSNYTSRRYQRLLTTLENVQLLFLERLY